MSTLSAITPRQQGFSLIEVMVAIGILSITAVLAGPSMSQWIQSNRVTSATNSLLTDLHQARSEAVRNNMAITLEPPSGVWGDGWRFFTNPDSPVNGLATFVAGGTNVLLKNTTPPNTNLQITASAGATPRMSFRANGSLSAQGGATSVTFTVADISPNRRCTGNAGVTGCSMRIITISPTGRPSVSNPNPFP